MRHDTFINALEATARIACCASLLGLVSCMESEKEDENDQTGVPDNTDTDPLTTDDDGDGYSENDGDCDDANANINPAATEQCNGVDDNCDAEIDNDAENMALWYIDADGDGFGGEESVQACSAPEGTSDKSGDCDDSQAMLTPADEDEDGFSSCDGDCDDTDAGLNPIDADTDGFSTCDGDCDDADPALDPADYDEDGQSSCDGDCDDWNANIETLDLDGDGYTTCEEDCHDNDATIFPDENGVCDLGDCETIIDSTFSQGTSPDSATEECCQLVAEYIDHNWDEYDQWQYRSECCNLLEWQGSMACTPWGPPTPPAMKTIA